MAMNKVLKNKWLRALRSGRYRKTMSRLVNDKGDAFCCLGVLADIQGCVWKENELGRLHPIMPHGKKLMSSSAFSPDLSCEGGFLRPRAAGGLNMELQQRLAAMNDKGKTFKQIAKVIEKEA